MRRDFFNECGDYRQGVCGIGGRGVRRRHQDTVMEMRGRNRKWLRAGNGRIVQIVRVDIAFQFSTGILQIRRGMNAFVVVDIVKCPAEVGHHKCVGGKNRSRNRRGSVNGKEGVDSRELAVDFFFLDVEKVSDVLDHLFMGKSHFAVSRAVRRGRGNKVRGVASVVDGGRRTGGNENGGGQARHGWTVVGCMEGKKGVCMVDAKRTVDWRGFCEV